MAYVLFMTGRDSFNYFMHNIGYETFAYVGSSFCNMINQVYPIEKLLDYVVVFEVFKYLIYLNHVGVVDLSERLSLLDEKLALSFFLEYNLHSPHLVFIVLLAAPVHLSERVYICNQC